MDRDGVLTNLIDCSNGRRRSAHRRSEMTFIPGAKAAVKALANHGLIPIVVTNQPDCERGLIAPNEISKMNTLLRTEMPFIVDIFVCPHVAQTQCACRKPKPTMLLWAAAKHNLNLDHAWMVGDQWTDIEAGRLAGARTILIQPGQFARDEKKNFVNMEIEPDLVADSLGAAVNYILKHSRDLGLPRG